MELVCVWPLVSKLFPFVAKALFFMANQPATAFALWALAFACAILLPAEAHGDPARFLSI